MLGNAAMIAVLLAPTASIARQAEPRTNANPVGASCPDFANIGEVGSRISFHSTQREFGRRMQSALRNDKMVVLAFGREGRFDAEGCDALQISGMEAAGSRGPLAVTKP